MVVFGLVLVALGAVIIVLGLFTSEVKFEDNEATVEIANVNLSTEGLFLAGVIAAALVLVGLWAVKLGAKMTWKHRKEQKRLSELSEKLEKAEAGRRRDDDDENNTTS
jgi:steroid 5-alpha reductase family enzyme